MSFVCPVHSHTFLSQHTMPRKFLPRSSLGRLQHQNGFLSCILYTMVDSWGPLTDCPPVIIPLYFFVYAGPLMPQRWCTVSSFLFPRRGFIAQGLVDSMADLGTSLFFYIHICTRTQLRFLPLMYNNCFCTILITDISMYVMYSTVLCLCFPRRTLLYSGA